MSARVPVRNWNSVVLTKLFTGPGLSALRSVSRRGLKGVMTSARKKCCRKSCARPSRLPGGPRKLVSALTAVLVLAMVGAFFVLVTVVGLCIFLAYATTAAVARRMGHTPRVAFLSYSPFGNPPGAFVGELREAGRVEGRGDGAVEVRAERYVARADEVGRVTYRAGD